MAQVQPVDSGAHSGFHNHVVAEAARFEPGGPVALLQSEIARRFDGEGVTIPFQASPVERAIRATSIAAGYLSLLAGFAAVAVALF